jgi:hypothetical protein
VLNDLDASRLMETTDRTGKEHTVRAQAAARRTTMRRMRRDCLDR